MLAGVRLPSAYYISIVLAFSAYSAGSANLAQEASQKGDIEVTVSLDVAEQSGSANATVRIHASRESCGVDHSCPESMRMFQPRGLDVLETAPDRSWQRIRHVMNYSCTCQDDYVIRAAYDRPSKVSIERISGIFEPCAARGN